MSLLKYTTVGQEIKDYTLIFLGISLYALGWCIFLLPYQISTGGVTGISAVVFYATQLPMQNTYLAINTVLLFCSVKILGWKFFIKTGFAILSLYFMLDFLQIFFAGPDGNPVQFLGEGQDFMACILGAMTCGLGLGIAFSGNGTTGGTDIIAAIVNKYRNVSMGSVIFAVDCCIVLSCYLVFHDWKRVVFGFVTMFMMTQTLDYYTNRLRQSVQFFIISKDYEKIAEAITTEAKRGCTLLDSEGYYSHQHSKIVMCIARQKESNIIFRIVKSIDPKAFITQSNVIGVFGEGFDVLKIKAKTEQNEQKA